MQCGAVNDEHVEMCSFCDAPLAQKKQAAVVAAGAGPTKASVAAKPAWRREVSHRLEAYRARRRRLFPDDSQPPLPFGAEEVAEQAGNGWSGGDPARENAAWPEDKHSLVELESSARESIRASRIERVEIDVTQPEPDYAAVQARSAAWHPRGAEGRVAPRPVAQLADRRRAGILDAVFMLLTYGGILALFHAFGGRFSSGKLDAVVYLGTFFLFYVQYFALFTVMGGSTPGMLLVGLRVVGFDGGPPAPRQLLWRSFGYLVSGGTALLGFLWALWDEDHLTWQDRISQTYLTFAEHFDEDESFAETRGADSAPR